MYFDKKENIEENVFLKNSKEQSYEEFVAGYYKLDGFNVHLNKKDVYKGIDIICMQDDILILIQCINFKNKSKNKISNESLNIFVNSSNEYISKNNLFNKIIKLKYIASDDILDDKSAKILREHKFLDYEVLIEKKGLLAIPFQSHKTTSRIKI
jgi:hypothetical protein